MTVECGKCQERCVHRVSWGSREGFPHLISKLEE